METKKKIDLFIEIKIKTLLCSEIRLDHYYSVYIVN